MAIEKIKILGALLELPAKQNCQFCQLGPILRYIHWLDWHCCLAGSFKRAPRIFIFSIVLGAEYLCYVKSIATFALTFFGYYVYYFSLSLIFKLLQAGLTKELHTIK